MNDASDSATEFFNLSSEEKMSLASSNVHEPVREKMGNYAKAAYKLQKQLMKVVFESLGLNANYLHDEIEKGSQVMAVNCYPACPEPHLALGMPPHSDYGSLTIINQSSTGLQIMDHGKNWHSVPVIEGALVVQLGDQLEIMSNGQYKSVIHRATVNSEKKRLSIAKRLKALELPLQAKIAEQNYLLNKGITRFAHSQLERLALAHEYLPLERLVFVQKERLGAVEKERSLPFDVAWGDGFPSEVTFE
ncbi:hypothetical protein RJ640_028482 [Escallonia rubra]|uniref:Fe2OG dioxygenase domain-containing protein n=1 Tax=Escallonia rubra TaxID=112253 RepID=A0AA88QD11_9ASTE|nr:hypothetical protein RJ640_028482 [Escallonia rubra]